MNTNKGWSPKGWGPNPENVGWGPEGWEAQHFVLFFPLMPQLSFFSSHPVKQKFTQIRDEEALDQDGFNAAMSHCARATKLGSKWTRLTGMTDRVEFLYLRKEFTETLSEKWPCI